MGLLRFYADGSDVGLQQLGEDPTLHYAIRNNVLALYWKKGRNYVHLRAGQMYDINYGEGKVCGVCRLIWPREKSDVLMWLLGFPRRTRRYGKFEYDQLIHKWKTENDDWWQAHHDELTECRFESEHYGFCQCRQDKIDGGNLPIAAYINRGITVDDALVKEVFHGWKYPLEYPRTYVKYVLCQVFNFTDKDLAELALK